MDVAIRALNESELAEAERIFRLAFGTFLGLPDPLTFTGDCAYVRTRWRVDPSATAAAVRGGELLGSNFATRWGSFGFFGPLSVRPELWDQGIAKRLLAATMDCLAAWRVEHAGLFTFPQSAKHIGLYMHYGFYPRFLTPIMSKTVGTRPPSAAAATFSSLLAGERAAALRACRGISSAILDGLDLEREIGAVHDQGLGDTILQSEEGELRGFAVCHVGPGTEAGGGVCYVKFGAVRPGPRAAADFERLLDACDSFAAARGTPQLVAGVNAAREAAYRALLARGFRTAIQGLAMHRPNAPGFNRPDIFVIDDWR
jgi:GNAT superfamily N-acetyltransferase